MRQNRFDMEAFSHGPPAESAMKEGHSSETGRWKGPLGPLSSHLLASDGPTVTPLPDSRSWLSPGRGTKAAGGAVGREPPPGGASPAALERERGGSPLRDRAMPDFRGMMGRNGDGRVSEEEWRASRFGWAGEGASYAIPSSKS